MIVLNFGLIQQLMYVLWNNERAFTFYTNLYYKTLEKDRRKCNYKHIVPTKQCAVAKIFCECDRNGCTEARNISA